MLRRRPFPGARKSRLPGASSPLVAALLAFVPGLGAVYNGQHIKALLSFAITVGLWQMADLLNLLFLGLGGVCFYFYSICDAYASAQRLRRGEDLSAEEEALKRLLREKTPLWGSVLIGVGLVSLLRFFVPPWYLERLWPLILIGVGLYLLLTYRRREAETVARYRTPPPSVIPYPDEFAAREYARSEARQYDR